MKLLLDTHTLIWFAQENEALPNNVRILIEDETNECFVSIVSFWEMAIKIAKGNLEIDMSLQEFYQLTLKNNINILGIAFYHFNTLLGLESYHNDPFDRLIISQAIAEDFVVLSKDKNFIYYPVKIIW
jgi:PIN domain nuclease of toxin-antitoxin system